MTTPTKTLVFDLDGTLVDSVRDLVPALNHTTAQDGLPPIEIEDVGHVVGKGALKMIELAFAFHNRPLSQERLMELFPQFLTYYEDHIADHTLFFDGVFEALDVLENEGWTFAVCTNKYQNLAEKLLHALGKASRFPVVTGGDTFDFKKPDPRHITETVALAGGTPERTIMVGDSINDIEAAHRANIPSIAVDFGYTDMPVADMNPTKIISHFDGLASAVRSIENDLFKS